MKFITVLLMILTLTSCRIEKTEDSSLQNVSSAIPQMINAKFSIENQKYNCYSVDTVKDKTIVFICQKT